MRFYSHMKKIDEGRLNWQIFNKVIRISKDKGGIRDEIKEGLEVR